VSRRVNLFTNVSRTTSPLFVAWHAVCSRSCDHSISDLYSSVQSTDVTQTSQYNAAASYCNTDMLCPTQMSWLKFKGAKVPLSLTYLYIVTTCSGGRGGFIPSINSELRHYTGVSGQLHTPTALIEGISCQFHTPVALQDGISSQLHSPIALIHGISGQLHIQVDILDCVSGQLHIPFTLIDGVSSQLLTPSRFIPSE